MTGKSELRKKALALRLSQNNEVLSREVCRNLSAWHLFQTADTVLAYAAFRGETDLTDVVSLALRLGKTVAFPKTLDSEGHMAFLRVHSLEELKPGRYGISEPVNGESVLPTERTLCLVPALAFDAKGNRLGYGGGFYDRFLRSFPGISAGILPSVCLFPELPHEAWDVPVQYLVTEATIVETQKSLRDSGAVDPDLSAAGAGEDR